MRATQQTIIVKQDDITRLNQEGARFVAELSHAQQALRDEQEQGRRLATCIDALQAFEQRCGILESRIADRELRMEELKLQSSAAATSAESAGGLLQTAQLELGATKAALAAQQEVVTELRAVIALHRTEPHKVKA